MEIRHLRYFVTTAEELHFTRAAKRLGIAQPPLSQQIQQLEREVGTQLFHRLSRGVELTEAGKSFWQDARAILDQIDRAQAVARGERGSIRIGFTSSASFNPFVPAVISEYRQKHRNVELSLGENTTSVLLEQLREGRLDFAFLRPAMGETGAMRTRLLFEEDMCVALPAPHPLVASPKIRLVALANEPFIMYPRANGRALYDTIIAGCRNAGFSPNIGQEAPQMASTVNLVAAGIGVAIVPASMRQLQSQGVTYRQIDGAPIKAALSLTYRDDPLSAAMTEFLSTVVRAVTRRERDIS
jgi:DNA-binding transcriptional LysR family regulator